MAKNDAHDGLAVVPWYWRDWRASTARAVLAGNPTAGWCYRELCDASWGQPDCGLPDDDAMLAALAGVTLDVWMSVRASVLAFLPLDDDGRRYQPRARHEWRKAKAFRKACRNGGKATASKRWGGGSHPVATLPPPNMGGNRSPSPSPSPTLHSSPSPTPTEAEKNQNQNQIAPRAEPRSAAIVARIEDFPAGPARETATAIRDCPIPAWRDDPAVTPPVVAALLQIASRCDVVAEIRACQAWWVTKPATTRGRTSCVGTLRNWLLKANERATTRPSTTARRGMTGGQIADFMKGIA